MILLSKEQMALDFSDIFRAHAHLLNSYGAVNRNGLLCTGCAVFTEVSVHYGKACAKQIAESQQKSSGVPASRD